MERFLLIASLVGASSATAVASTGDLELMQISKATQTMSRNERGREFFNHAGVPIYPLPLPVARTGEGEAPRSWIFGMNSDSTDQELLLMSQEPEFQGTGTHTNPDLGESPFVFGNLTESGMRAVLDRYSENVRYVDEDGLQIHVFEPDLGVELDPELQGVCEPWNGVTSDNSDCLDYPWGIGSVNADKGRPRGTGTNLFSLDTGVRTTHHVFLPPEVFLMPDNTTGAGPTVTITNARAVTKTTSRAFPYLDYTRSDPVCDVTDTSCASDVNGHGTHCAATAAGNLYGVANMATVWAVKILNDDGTGSSTDMIRSLSHIYSHGARPAVVSMSVSGAGTPQSVEDAIDPLVDGGVSVVVAAGNDNGNACSYFPGFVTKAITVASYDSLGAKSSFSNYGSCIDVWAPGSGILSASPVSDTASSWKSGTSMAAPHVAGLSAILHEDHSYQSMTPSVRWTLLTVETRNNITGIPSTYGTPPFGNLVALAPSVTPAPTPDGVSGVGDPHLTNMYGERFDLFRSGVHVLLQIPRWGGPEQTLLRLEAEAMRTGGACSDVYFQTVRIAGHWTNRSHALEFSAKSNDRSGIMKWTRFGKVDLKVVKGTTHEGTPYLNVFARHLGNAGFAVGGLLGVDSNIEATTPEAACSRTMTLSKARARV